MMAVLMCWIVAMQFRSIDVTDGMHRDFEMLRREVLFDESNLPPDNITMQNFETSFMLFWGIAEFD